MSAPVPADPRPEIGSAADPDASRAAFAVFAVFVLSGFVFANWVSRLPAVRDALDLSPASLGLLLLVGAAGSVIALPLTGAVVQRIGTERAVLLAASTSVAGFAGSAVAVGLGQVPLLALTLFVAQAGMGAWDVGMNIEGGAVEHRLRRAIMPRFHAGFSLGTVAGAGTGALASLADVSVTVHLLVVLTAVEVGLVVAVRRFLPDEEAGPDGGARGGLRASLRSWREGRTLLIGLVVLAAALTEGAANDWLALAVVDGFDQPNAVGAAAFGVFVAAMTTMRLLGTRLLDRFGRVPVLRLCTGLALVGLALFTLGPSLGVALVGAVLWGLGAALGFPVGMSAASDEPLRAAPRVAVVSSIGYTAFLAGPPLLGLLAEVVGYRLSLLAIAAPLVLSLLVLPAARQLGGAPSRPTPAPPARPERDAPTLGS